MLALRLWLGKKIYGSGISSVRISPNRMVKWGCEEPELEAHRYIAANTTIPVPKLHRVHNLRGKLALEMEFLSGCETLKACWNDFTDVEKQALVDEIAGYIKQLRELEPLDAHRIRVGSVRRFGPFDDIPAFHKLIRGNCDLERSKLVFGEDVVRVHERENYGIRFTHGDLGVQNILVRDNATVAAIIDWECAGWYPEYWDYTMAHYNHIFCMEFYAMLRERVDRYDDELKAERLLWRWLDQPLDESWIRERLEFLLGSTRKMQNRCLTVLASHVEPTHNQAITITIAEWVGGLFACIGSIFTNHTSKAHTPTRPFIYFVWLADGC